MLRVKNAPSNSQCCEVYSISFTIFLVRCMPLIFDGPRGTMSQFHSKPICSSPAAHLLLRSSQLFTETTLLSLSRRKRRIFKKHPALHSSHIRLDSYQIISTLNFWRDKHVQNPTYEAATWDSATRPPPPLYPLVAAPAHPVALSLGEASGAPAARLYLG